MFTVTVEAGFTATHMVRFSDGRVEPVHDHDWLVRAFFTGERLGESGMVIDFEEARSGLQSALSLLHETDLNEHPSFLGRNPTAEVVAKFVFDELQRRRLPGIRKVEVTEAPGCLAAFESDLREPKVNKAAPD